MTVTRRRALAAVTGLCAASAWPASARADVPIRIGTVTTDPGMQPLYAKDRGLFKDAGLEAEVSILNNASVIVAAIASGSLDVGQASVSPAALAREHGIRIRFVAPGGIYTAPPGNTILMVPNASPIKSAADLNGKTIAVGILRDLTQYEVSAWMDKSGGDSKSVHFIEARISEMPAILDEGRAAAAVLIEPFITTAKSEARVLANMSESMGGPYMVSGWIATDDWIRSSPDALARFRSVLQRAAVWANAHPKDSAQTLVRWSKISPQVAAQMHRVHYAETATIDPAMVQRPIDLLVRYGALSPLNASELIASP